jgi:hypothetical protein
MQQQDRNNQARQGGQTEHEKPKQGGNQPGQEDRGGAGETDQSRRNPADNLTREARIRGGMHSAKNQQRDAFGQFAGRKGTAEDASRIVRGRRARGRGEGSGEGGGAEENPPNAPPRGENQNR